MARRTSATGSAVPREGREVPAVLSESAADEVREAQVGEGVDGATGPVSAGGVPGRGEALARWTDRGADGVARLLPAEGVADSEGAGAGEGVEGESGAGPLLAEAVPVGEGVRAVGTDRGVDGDAGPVPAEGVPRCDDPRARWTGNGADADAGLTPAEGAAGCEDALAVRTDTDAVGVGGTRPVPAEGLPDSEGAGAGEGLEGGACVEPLFAEPVPDGDVLARWTGEGADGDAGLLPAEVVPGCDDVRARCTGDGAAGVAAFVPAEGGPEEGVRGVRTGADAGRVPGGEVVPGVGAAGEAGAGLLLAEAVPVGEGVRAVGTEGGVDGDAGPVPVAGTSGRGAVRGCWVDVGVGAEVGPVPAAGVSGCGDVRARWIGAGAEAGLVPAEDVLGCDGVRPRWIDGDTDGGVGPLPTGGVPGCGVMRAGGGVGPVLAASAAACDEVPAARAGAGGPAAREGVPEGDTGPVARRWIGAGAAAEEPGGRIGGTVPRPLSGFGAVRVTARRTGTLPGAEGAVRESSAPTPPGATPVDDADAVRPGPPSVPSGARAPVGVVSFAAGSDLRCTGVVPAGARVREGVRDVPEATGVAWTPRTGWGTAGAP